MTGGGRLAAGRRGDPASPRPYRGPDRRVRSSDRVELGRAWLIAGVLLVLLIGAMSTMAMFVVRDGITGEALTALRSASVAVSMLLAVVSLMTWRATGEVAGLRVSVFASALALVAVAGALGIGETNQPVEAALRPALVLVATVFFAAAMWGPDVDASTSVLREYRNAALLLVVTWLVLVSTPLAAWMASTPGVDHLIALVPWAALGATGVLRAVDGRSYLMAWVSWSALALALGEFARYGEAVQAEPWHFAGLAIQVSGLMVATIGATMGLGRTVVRGRDESFRAELLRLAREDSLARERAEREHEIRNALFSIEGATLTLNRFRDQLDEADQRALAAAVTASIERLRELVSPTRPSTGAHLPFRLFDVLREQVLLARTHDLPVLLEFDIGEDTVVVGDQTTTVRILTNLLTNARRHGGASNRSPVLVQVAGVDDMATIRVIDNGPGVPTGHGDAIFERGVRLSSDVEGEGIGLSLARQLARAQGGDLWLEPRDRGACFVLTIPLVRDLEGSAGSREADEVDHGG